MKTIHLLRHAKSSWADDKISDIDRPLTDRGKRACLLMVEPIWRAGCQFKNVYVSPAKRTCTTIKRIERSLPQSRGIRWTVDDRLYTFSSEELLHWLRELPERFSQVTVVGHNPALRELASQLGDLPVDSLPTCGYVQLQADVDNWQQLDSGCARTTAFLTPSMYEMEEA